VLAFLTNVFANDFAKVSLKKDIPMKRTAHIFAGLTKVLRRWPVVYSSSLEAPIEESSECFPAELVPSIIPLTIFLLLKLDGTPFFRNCFQSFK
jgi:hypothetical protein